MQEPVVRNVARVGLVLLTGLLMSACQTTMQSGSQCVVQPGDLDHARAFYWHSATPVDVLDTTGYVGPLAMDALALGVIETLERKGMYFAGETMPEDLASSSDAVSVALTLRTRRELVSFETDGNLCRDVDCWERIDPGVATRMDIRTIGFLAADVYHQGKPIWRGWVETTLYPKDRDQAEAVIAEALPKLFATYPP